MRTACLLMLLALAACKTGDATPSGFYTSGAAGVNARGPAAIR